MSGVIAPGISDWATCRAIFLLVAMVASAAQAAEEPRPRRAKPPEWTADVLDVFFPDAREQLVGERPAANSATAVAEKIARDGDEPREAAKDFAWSRIVGGDTLESEVKRLVSRLVEPLANPAKFKAGGYKDCRLHFSELAVLFAVIAEHDGDVRWKDEAGVMRASLARAAMNCKTATDQTFAEAALRRTELEDLMRGERLSGEAAPLERWSDLAERPLLMQRMESLLQEEIQPALGNEKEFAKRADEVRQWAELLGVLSDVMQREEYEYWDDAGFQELSTELRDATAELSRAAAEVNYEAVRAAAGRTGQACSQCHEGYRG